MLDAHTVQELIEDRGDPRVSIFLPTHERGAETRQDPIRLGNRIDEAEKALAERKYRDASGMLEPARALLGDEDFWLHQGRGLALFISPEDTRIFRVPRDLPERTVVSDRFHIKPLLPLLTGDGRFHILAVSQSRVRLFDASRDSIRAIDLHDVPESLRDAVGYDWEEKSLQFHAVSRGARAGAGAGPGVQFHGQGAGDDDAKREIRKYLQLVDRGLMRLLHDRSRPMVLAAVDYVAAMYREVSKYPKIVAGIVEGNPDHRSPEELRDAAWTLVEPEFQAARDAATSRYRELGGGNGGHTSDDLETIVPAAFAGRIQTLFVARDVEQWGQYDPQETRLVLHGARRAEGDDDLLDVAAAETLVRAGDIYALDAEDMPGSAIAAILRY